MERTPDQKALIALLQAAEIFAKVDADSCHDLVDKAEIVKINTNHILFTQGAPADGLYVVISGQLKAILLDSDGHPHDIGIIKQGETVGELGSLSNAARTLSVIALTDCVLMKLRREVFAEFCQRHPQIMFTLLDFIINRSQNTIKLLSKAKDSRHLAIITGHDGALPKQFIRELVDFIEPKYNLVVVRELSSADQLAQLMRLADEEKKLLAFIITADDQAYLERIRDCVHVVYIVVEAHAHKKLSSFCLHIINRQIFNFATRLELILLYPHDKSTRYNTRHWLEQAPFTLHHHVALGSHADYHRMLRFKTGKGVGLVIGGGGGKGWASLGVLKAILDSGIQIDMIGGTSVGAVVAACYAKSLDYHEALNDFTSLIRAMSKPFSLYNFTWPLISILSSKKPTQAAIKLFGDLTIEDLKIPFFSVATNITTRKQALHQTGLLWERLRATVAIPGLMPPVLIDGEMYADGGLVNNLPVDCMRALIGDQNPIIGVCLASMTNQTVRYNFPPILPFRVGLLRKLGIGYQEYSFPPFFDTFISALQIGSHTQEIRNKAACNLLITPPITNHMLQFDVRLADELIEVGYRTAEIALQQWQMHPVDKKNNNSI